MDIEYLREYCLSMPGVTEDMPYGDDMVVFRIEGKIFLHLPLEYAEPRMSVKLPPEEGRMLRDQHSGIKAAYHLNKTHWNDILLEGHFTDTQLKEWIQTSYHLVLSRLPKAIRQKYDKGYSL